MSALGEPRLVDPGITTYAPDVLSDYYRSAGAHNTVLVDGCGPDRATTPFPLRDRRDVTVNAGIRATPRGLDGVDEPAAAAPLPLPRSSKPTLMARLTDVVRQYSLLCKASRQL